MADEPEALIETGALVSLHFSLALGTGEVIDSNFDQQPASLRLGDGSMLPGFEAVLCGLQAGEEIERLLPAEQAFGPVNPDNQHRFPIAKFAHLLEDDLIPTAVGSVISFKDVAGFDLPGVVTEIGENFISVDFNHPLAGKQILFKARIVSVVPPDVEAIEVKL
ncbi:MAG: peptidylprolyl isomerase [Proteobacteria bacterium]|nr:peptidylprolyl isomerase [Pseudomonadota bacterium]